MALFKDTIRLVVQFRDFDGRSVSPQNVKLTIYDDKQQLLETISTNIEINNNTYFYDYVVPEHDFIYEFSGAHKGKPILARQSVNTKFI